MDVGRRGRAGLDEGSARLVLELALGHDGRRRGDGPVGDEGRLLRIAAVLLRLHLGLVVALLAFWHLDLRFDLIRDSLLIARQGAGTPARARRRFRDPQRVERTLLPLLDLQVFQGDAGFILHLHVLFLEVGKELAELEVVVLVVGAIADRLAAENLYLPSSRGVV